MLLTAIVTFILVSKLPEKFKSNAILSSGIVEFKGVNIEQDNPFIQKFQVENAFSNLREGILSRSSLKLLTKRLMKHDLTSNSESPPFRILTSDNESPSSKEVKEVAKTLELKEIDENSDYHLEEEDVSNNSKQEQNRLFKDVAKALEYDYESLRENLDVARIGETDYLNIEFVSENPELSYFAVSAFCDEIIKLDRSIQSDEESTAFNFYKELAVEKKASLDELLKELNQYKRNKNLVNLEEQTKSIVSQIRELELLREQIKKEIPSLEENIKNLDHYIKQTARVNADNYTYSVLLNEDVQELSEQIKILNDQYITGGKKDKSLESRLENMREERSKLVGRIAAKEVVNADENIERNKDLLDKRIEKELDLSTAKESSKSLDKEIYSLKSKARSLVSDDAYVGNLEQQIIIAEKEYFGLVDKLHAVEQVTKKEENRLSLIEPAQVPEEPEPKNKILLSAFAGASSGILTTVLLFLLAFFDNSPNSLSKFSSLTGLSPLGSLNKLKSKKIGFNTIFSGNAKGIEVESFLESTRKIRYAIEVSGAKTFLVTSTKSQSGKSFFILALAYSMSLTNRSVLIIDANFKNNSLSTLANMPLSDSPFKIRAKGKFNDNKNGNGLYLPVRKEHLPKNIDIIGNSSGNLSPTEALAGRDLVRLLHEYSRIYDYIFIEGAALNQYADSRELAMFVEKIIAVFSSNAPIQDADKESIDFLKNQDDKFFGSVLNEV